MSSAMSTMRECIIGGSLPELDTTTETVSIKDPKTNQIITFHRKTLLPWRLKSGSFLEIDALALLIANAGAKLSEYIKLCRANDCQPIPFSEWPPLRQYMKGDLSTHGSIDLKGFAAVNQGEEIAEKVEEPNQSINQSIHQPIIQTVDSASGVPQQMSAWTLDDVIKQERLVANRVSFMQGKRPLSMAIDLYDSAQREREKARHAQSKLKAEQRKSSSSPTHAKSSIPIIVVPSSLSASITLYNIKQFLESGLFVSTTDARTASPAKPSKIIVERPSLRDRTRPVYWECLDDTSKLRTPEDWARVVAVFVAGPDWQFDNWPYTSIDPKTQKPKPNPAKIFEKVCPFHVRYEAEPLNVNVQNWKVHRLTVNPAKSYNDRSQAMEFWQIVTEFVQTRKEFKHLNV